MIWPRVFDAVIALQARVNAGDLSSAAALQIGAGQRVLQRRLKRLVNEDTASHHTAVMHQSEAGQPHTNPMSFELRP